MKANCVVTLYNHYTNPDTERVAYKRTVIKNVNWQEYQKTSVTEKGLLSANQINVFVPFNSDFEGKEYIGPKEYRGLSNEDKEKYFTFDNDDYIVKGEIDESLTVDTLKKKYDNVMTVISVLICDNCSNSMKHYELAGK